MKSILDKLLEDYLITIKLGNGGHAAGYYNELDEKIQERYEFEKGVFTTKYSIKYSQEDFTVFYYTPKIKKT